MTAKAQYTIAELVQRTGVNARTIRYWVKLGLVEAPPFRGPATTYGPEFLARLQAVQLLRAQNVGLRAIKKRISKATDSEIASMVAPPAPSIGDRPTPRPPSYPAEIWERIVLAPGLEVHVRADAGAMLRRVADDIFRHYGSWRPGP